MPVTYQECRLFGESVQVRVKRAEMSNHGSAQRSFPYRRDSSRTYGGRRSIRARRVYHRVSLHRLFTVWRFHKETKRLLRAYRVSGKIESGETGSAGSYDTISFPNPAGEYIAIGDWL
jgi:hypothetical protein